MLQIPIKVISIRLLALITKKTQMARITVEDCLENEGNRFSLVQLAAARTKELLEGKEKVTDTRNNREIVSALREIASGKVRYENSSDLYQDQEEEETDWHDA